MWSLEAVKVMHSEALSKGITLAELLALSEVASSSSSTNFDHPVSDRPDQWDANLSNAQTVTVETAIDPSDPCNRTSLRGLSEEDRQKLTDEHRNWASDANEPPDLDSLVKAVSLTALPIFFLLEKLIYLLSTDQSSAFWG